MKSFSWNIGSKWVFCLATALIIFFIHNSATSQEINLSSGARQSESVILSYRETLGGTREMMESASLTIFDDGYMQIHRPHFMKQGGTYGTYLDAESLEHLWHLLTAKEILEFDAANVRNKIKEINQQQKALLSSVANISDAPTTILEIYPNRYKSAVDAFGQGDLHAKKIISWRGLRWTAEQYPNIEEIKPLIKIQHEIEKIMDHPDFEIIN